MKRYKLKQWVQDVIVTLGITTFMLVLLSCLSWNVKKQNQRLIEQEYNKKTDMCAKNISQK